MVSSLRRRITTHRRWISATALVVPVVLFMYGFFWKTGAVDDFAVMNPGGDMATDMLFSFRQNHGEITLHGHHSRIGTYHPGPAYMWTMWVGQLVSTIAGKSPYLGAAIAYYGSLALLVALAAAAMSAALRSARGGIALLGVLVAGKATDTLTWSSMELVVGYITAQTYGDMALIAAVACAVAAATGVRWARPALALSSMLAVHAFMPTAIPAAVMAAVAASAEIVVLIRGKNLRERMAWTTLGVYALMALPMLARLFTEGFDLPKRYLGGYDNLDRSQITFEIVRSKLELVWGVSFTTIIAISALTVAATLVALVAPGNSRRRRGAATMLGLQVLFVAVAFYQANGYTEPYTLIWTMAPVIVTAAIALALVTRFVPQVLAWALVVTLMWVQLPLAGELSWRDDNTASMGKMLRTVPEISPIADRLEAEAVGRPVYTQVYWNDDKAMLAVFNNFNPLALELQRRNVEICLHGDDIRLFILPPEFSCEQPPAGSRKLVIARVTDLVSPLEPGLQSSYNSFGDTPVAEVLSTWVAPTTVMLGQLNGWVYLLTGEDR